MPGYDDKFSYGSYLRGGSDREDNTTYYGGYDSGSYNYTSVARNYVLYDEPYEEPDNERYTRPNGKQGDKYVKSNKNVSAAKKQKAAQAPDTAMKKELPKRGTVIKIIFVAVAIMALLYTLLDGNVQTNKMYRLVAEENTLYEDAKSENVRLKSVLEGKMTLKNVEEYAEKVLGLRKLDNSQIKYIQTQKDDTVEIAEEEDKGFFATIKEKFTGFLEYIFG